MYFELNVFDRVVLLNILPQNIDMMLYGIYHNFLKDVSFSEDEYEEYEISVDETNQVHWKNGEEKDIYINENILGVIKDILKNCKEKGLLQEEHMSLYNKFVSEV